MNVQHRYGLASNRHPKLDCPYCHAKRHWQRYYDKVTGDALPDQYGLCDNAGKCGQGLNPYTDGYAKMIWQQEQGNQPGQWKPNARFHPPKPIPKADPVFIPPDVLKGTLQGYKKNVFISNLSERVAFPFAAEALEKVISQYYLGTISSDGYWAGAVTFPFIDVHHRTRAIQVKKFDSSNHTVKTSFIHSLEEKHHQRNSKPIPNWIELYKGNELKVSCLFGEHLLYKYPDNPVALVEAPKTAIYGTVYFGFPDDPGKLLWLAVYNLSSLNYAKCRVLEGRKVFLFPDLSEDGHAFKKWSSRAKELERLMPGTRYKVSDLLESIAEPEQRKAGADLADYLIKLDWRKFRKESNGLPHPSPPERVDSVVCEAETTSFFYDEEAILSQPGTHTVTNHLGREYTVTINEDRYPANWDL